MKLTSLPLTPTCTFCGQAIEKPQPLDAKHMGECNMGRCQCGAIYASDATGHNIGNAMVECLVHACNGNWDLAWNLLPDEDYLTGRLEDYDEVTHQVVETRNLDGRCVRGVLFFVRLHKEISEITERTEEKKETSTVPMEPLRDPKREKQRTSKSHIATLVAAGDIDGLVDLCFDDPRTLRFMQRLLYTPDEAQRWWTANVLGEVCGRFSTRHPGQVSDLLYRLFEACSDSASTSWGLIEAIGTIIAARPDIYGAFTRHLLRYASDPNSQAGMLWAIGTIAGPRPDLIRQTAFFKVLGFLQNSDPTIRGLMARILGRLHAAETKAELKKLKNDDSEITIYEQGRAIQTRVSDLVLEALALIDQQGDQPNDR